MELPDNSLTVRRLLIDLDQGFEKRWFNNDAFKTAFFNAMSMTFPVGEQFFIDSVRDSLPLIPEQLRAPHQAHVKGFVGQEATHRRIHDLFNRHLNKQGFINKVGPRLKSRAEKLMQKTPLHRLAVTAAYEHFTAVFAEWVLSDKSFFNGVMPTITDMWLWHASEESEHKSVAFDVYMAAGGDLKWRRYWMRLVIIDFVLSLGLQIISNLYRDGAIFKFSTWVSCFKFLFGNHGLVRKTRHPLGLYMHKDFHPEKVGDPRLSQEWLRRNSEKWLRVDGGAKLQSRM